MIRGGEAFDQTYSAIYGARWESIKEAMLTRKDSRAWNAGGLAPYLMDSASILAALSLPLCGAKRILDCCAAPGGKTIVLASMMDEDAALTANDRSRERCARLKNTIRECLPPEIQSRVAVTAGDASLLARKKPPAVSRPLSPAPCFDAILLDAPCSSERHVLSSPRHLAQWTPARIKNLRAAQWALLSAAFRLLSGGGVLVYATCALHHSENDGAINRLLKKFPGARIIEPQEPPARARDYFEGPLPQSEQTETGRLILPDAAGGAGPMFFACVQK